MVINPLVAHSAVGLVLHGSELADSINSISIGKNITMTIVDACLPPNVKYPLRCSIFLGLCVYSICSPQSFSRTACYSSVRSVLT